MLTANVDVDLATPQVARYGEIVRTCTLFIPERELFPIDQLHPLDGNDQAHRDRQLKLDL